MNKIYTNCIENYIVSFMSIFTDIYVNIYRDCRRFSLEVPVLYGNFNKYEKARKFLDENNNNLNKNIAYYDNSPIIVIKLEKIKFEKAREEKNIFASNLSYTELENKYLKSRIPINVGYVFTVNIYSKYIDTFGQIIEEIFPKLIRPYVLKIKEFPWLGINDITRSVIVELDSESLDIKYQDEKDLKDTDTSLNELNTSFTFTVHGVMHYPIDKTETTLITEIGINYFFGEEYVAKQSTSLIEDIIDYSEYLKLLNLQNSNAFIKKTDNGYSVLNQYQDMTNTNIDIENVKSNLSYEFIQRLERDYNK